MGVIVSSQPVDHCPRCGGKVEQDSDTLDTWFSSGLWTWSTLIDPAIASDFSLSFEDLLKQSPDFRKFHPTDVLETAGDILFFWVARMILMTTYAIGQIPFKTVYLHGLVRTREGKKMSKSDPTTCVDPLEIIPVYGADALRLAMIVGQMPGNDFQLYTEKIAGYRNFINKLWNASRFVLLQCEKAKIDPQAVHCQLLTVNLSTADRALLSSLQRVVADVTSGLEHDRLSEVGERLYAFVWDYFCDWYLEIQKGSANPAVLVHALRTIVHLLHPYCPFVTEELWSQIRPEGAGLLIREPWPEVDESLRDSDAEEGMQAIIEAISAIRSIRAEHMIEQGTCVPVFIHSKKFEKTLKAERERIIRMGKLSSLSIDAAPQTHEHAASVFLKDMEVHLPLVGVIDLAKEQARLLAESEHVRKFMHGIEAKMKNKKFLENAPEGVIATERERLLGAKEKLKKIEARLRAF
ncbi:MAG: class I tRNA ligase family protein [Candidatus Peregrinibacteria bacterium]